MALVGLLYSIIIALAHKLIKIIFELLRARINWNMMGVGFYCILRRIAIDSLFKRIACTQQPLIDSKTLWWTRIVAHISKGLARYFLTTRQPKKILYPIFFRTFFFLEKIIGNLSFSYTSFNPQIRGTRKIKYVFFK